MQADLGVFFYGITRAQMQADSGCVLKTILSVLKQNVALHW